MKCLCRSACSAWLNQRGIPEAPYERAGKSPGHYLQFTTPRTPSQIGALTRTLFEQIGAFPGALIVFTDWPTYYRDEMAIMNSLRRAHGETRPLIDAPGHEFTELEGPEAIGHCSLALGFQWSAYLYFASGTISVLFWEGDLVDVWGTDRKLMLDVRSFVREFKLQITSDSTE